MTTTLYPPHVMPEPAAEPEPARSLEVPHAFRFVVEHLHALANAGATFTGCAEELALLVAKSAGFAGKTCSWGVNGTMIEQAWHLRVNPNLVIDAIRDDRVRAALKDRGVSLSHRRIGTNEKRTDVAEGHYITMLTKAQ